MDKSSTELAVEFFNKLNLPCIPLIGLVYHQGDSDFIELDIMVKVDKQTGKVEWVV